MKTNLALLLPILLALTLAPAGAAVRYVNLANPGPAPPYTTWATAATNIQDAIDAADAGDEVIVSNGVYDTGQRDVFGMNRVAITKPVSVRSLNGPEATVIDGRGMMRGVHLVSGSSLTGFTVTNGWALEDGGIWCADDSVVLSNCVLANNNADNGGGAVVRGTLEHCTLTGNSARWGGGAIDSTMNNCTLIGNSARDESGGGARTSKLNNCRLMNNSAWRGGGAADSELNGCTLTGNSAAGDGGFGGGVSWCVVNNCLLTGNTAQSGGGAVASTLNNCTIVGNTAAEGGGIAASFGTNCIVYFNVVNGFFQNTANYDLSSKLSYSCTAPLPISGVGNISVDPQLASASHLSAGSPCRGAGNDDYATGTDIDGESWLNPPSIGCDELRLSATTGPLNVEIAASYTNMATGFEVSFTALIDGRVHSSRWDFGDGASVSNRPYALRRWTVPGDYPVQLWAYNESHPNGMSATIIVRVVEQVHYVDANSTNPVPPYDSWATAATTIQDAVDAASVVDEFEGVVPVVGGLVLVTNGTYQGGVTVPMPLTLQSVNGPDVTVIDGGGTIGCVVLGEGATLTGFTVTNGYGGRGGGVSCASATAIVSNCWLTANTAGDGGGGVFGGTLYNCTLTNNSAAVGSGGGASGSILNHCLFIGNSAGFHGGGAVGCTLNNCWLIGNSTTGDRGAASGCTLNNCTVTGNVGGGALSSTLNNCTVTGNFGGGVAGRNPGGLGEIPSILRNCIVVDNQAPQASADSNYNQYCHFEYSCSTPLPPGLGNIESAPGFVDSEHGNFRLLWNSPCINAGRNAYASGETDLDGNPRMVGGTVDAGAYEFQSPQSLISYAWLQQFGLSIDGSADTLDPDRDHSTNFAEWRAGTVPTNAFSLLRMLMPEPSGPSLFVRWESVPGRTYFLERSTNLGANGSFTPVARNIPGEFFSTTTTYSDALVPTNGQRYFYRIGVE